MRSFAIRIGILFTLLLITLSTGAQTKRGKSPVRKAAQPAVTATPVAQPTPEKVSDPQPAKRNERPDKHIVSPPGGDQSNTAEKTGDAFVYRFSRPGFTVGDIRIEHNEKGEGTMTFMHKDSQEWVTDPISISFVTMKRITDALKALDFLNSTENYQYEKDYSHMGNLLLTVKSNGKERTAGFNWTENKNARVLADEYRKISNQYLWVFDINLARENQPLEAPRLFAGLDSYLKRNEISDPPQLIPFLKELINDERIPLMGRNHAERLVKQIEKSQNR